MKKIFSLVVGIALLTSPLVLADRIDLSVGGSAQIGSTLVTCGGPIGECRQIGMGVYCGNDCKQFGFNVYCGYSCTQIGFNVYCGERSDDYCSQIGMNVYCGTNCRQIGFDVYCSAGRANPAVPATPTSPSNPQ